MLCAVLMHRVDSIYISLLVLSDTWLTLCYLESSEFLYAAFLVVQSRSILIFTLENGFRSFGFAFLSNVQRRLYVSASGELNIDTTYKELVVQLCISIGRHVYITAKNFRAFGASTQCKLVT